MICQCERREEKSDRKCLICRNQLKEDSPNWFYCSFSCMDNAASDYLPDDFVDAQQSEEELYDDRD